MEMKNFIETAEKKAGKQIQLANILGISDAYIRAAKRGSRGLPVDICILLADYIKADRLEVIAASNLVTEKDEKKRRILESCFSRAASVVIAVSAASILTLSPSAPIHAVSEEIINNNMSLVINFNKSKREIKEDGSSR